MEWVCDMNDSLDSTQKVVANALISVLSPFSAGRVVSEDEDRSAVFEKLHVALASRTSRRSTPPTSLYNDTSGALAGLVSDSSCLVH